MFSRNPNQKVLSALIAVVFNLLVPINLWSQSVGDSIEVNYDSIQDIRANRMERQMDLRMERIEGAQDETDEAIDSMDMLLERLHDHLERLELEKQMQSDSLSILREDIKCASESYRAYRERLHRILWATVSVLLILMIAASLFLLIYTVQTRNLLLRKILALRNRTGRSIDKLKWKQRRYRKEMKAEQEAIQNTAKKEIRKGLKSLKIKRKKRS